MKEVQGYIEDGVTPEGLTQPIVDPDAHSGSEEEGEEEEEEEEKKGEEQVGVTSSDNLPSTSPVPMEDEVCFVDKRLTFLLWYDYSLI